MHLTLPCYNMYYRNTIILKRSSVFCSFTVSWNLVCTNTLLEIIGFLKFRMVATKTLCAFFICQIHTIAAQSAHKQGQPVLKKLNGISWQSSGLKLSVDSANTAYLGIFKILPK